MLSKNKAIVFDLDGTLMDTIRDLTYSVNEMLTHFGYEKIDDNKTLSAINHGARSLIYNCLPVKLNEQDFEERFKYYLQAYANNTCERTTVFDGILELLIKCRENGYKICIATNKQLDKTIELCKLKFPTFKFDYILGVEKGVVPKPDPTAILNMLDQLNVLPKDAFLVGDGDTDVLTAINAKIKGVAVLWGYRSKQALENAGAKVFVSTVKELEKILLA